LNNQSIKNHHLYTEYAQMRVRERKLLRDEEEIRELWAEVEEDGLLNDYKKVIDDFKETCKKFASARKKLDYVEEILRAETA